jgi:N4-gp56 family major capsid protein
METTVLSGLELTKWQKKFIKQYLRGSGFESYMGDSESNIIHVRSDLETDGYVIRVPLLMNLRSEGVTGNQKLSGNEEPLDTYYFDVTWEFYRHGVETSKKEREKSAQDLLAEKNDLLSEWASEKIKYQIVDAFHSINGVLYANASEAQKDAWLAGNSDRVLFGNLISNHSSGDHSTSLGNIDTTNDKGTAATVHLLKRRARMAYPRLRPYKTKSGREYYLWFVHPRVFRDLWNDAAIYAANKDARPREGGGMDDNPIFQDGDLIYKGVIMREIPEFEVAKNSSAVNTTMTLVGVGASTSDVCVGVFCGCQAISYVNKQLAKPTAKKETDYDFFKGVGIEMAHGMEKTRWANNTAGALTASKDFGMMTTYHSGTADV